MSKRIDFKESNVDGYDIYTGYVDNKHVYTVIRAENYIWIAFDSEGNCVDTDQYRYDLFERLELQEIPCNYDNTKGTE